MVTDVRIGGAPVDLGMVLAENITVLHGRSAVDGEPTPSSAEVHLLVPQTKTLPGWSAGDALEVATAEGPLFTGTITDRRIPGHVDTLERGRCAQLELIATGTLATAGFRVVGDEPWPQEPGSARAQRILDLAGLPGLVEVPTGPEVQVLARDVDAQPALTLLTDLAATTGAAVVDLPDGRVLYQPLECRSRPVFRFRWMDFDPAFAWADFDPAFTWADFDVISPAAKTPLPLPPGAVMAEPSWVSDSSRIINRIRVGYGPDTGSGQSTREAQDAASIARYGLRYAYLGTALATQADAEARVARVISTQAWERWALAGVTVIVSELDPDTAAALAGVACGGWVEVTGLPMPAPATAWAGIVEGWAYTEHHPREDVAQVWLSLALSDPLHSMAVMTWADYPPDFEWQDHAAYLTWADLTTVDVLTGD